MNINILPGESLWFYSNLFQIPLPLIIDSNLEINPNQIQVGQIVKIPGFIAEAYTIKPGDNLWTISQYQNVSFPQLLRLNHHINVNQLQIGSEILLPRRVTWRIVNGKQPYTYELFIQNLRQLQYIYPL